MADNTKIVVGNLDEDLRTFDIAVFITAPSDGEYTLVSKASHAFQFKALNIKLTSGTITAEIRITNVPVSWTGPVTELSVTSSEINTLSVSDFQVGIGSRVTLVVSDDSTPVGLEMTAKCRRT